MTDGAVFQGRKRNLSQHKQIRKALGLNVQNYSEASEDSSLQLFDTKSFHHTFLFEPKVMSSGVSGKFFSDHSETSSGCTSAKLLFIAKPQPPCA